MTGSLANVDPISREPLAVEVTRRLVTYLLAGEVKPGERIPSERQLAAAFGVGRSAMREGIRALALLGVVEVRHGNGIYLKRTESALLPQVVEWGLLLGEKRTLDLIEARRKIEVDIVALAAERRADDDVAELRRALDRMGQAGVTNEAFTDADLAFHLTLARAAGNTALREILSGIQGLLRAWIARVTAAGSVQVSYREHIPVFEAVTRGDVAAAEAAMEDHMRSATHRLGLALDDARVLLAPDVALPGDGAWASGTGDPPDRGRDP